jgi:hypothetical protein
MHPLPPALEVLPLVHRSSVPVPPLLQRQRLQLLRLRERRWWSACWRVAPLQV